MGDGCRFQPLIFQGVKSLFWGDDSVDSPNLKLPSQVFIINTWCGSSCRSRPSESHHDCSSPVAMQLGTGVFNGEYIMFHNHQHMVSWWCISMLVCLGHLLVIHIWTQSISVHQPPTSSERRGHSLYLLPNTDECRKAPFAIHEVSF